MIGLFQPESGRRLSGHPITDKLVMGVNFSKAHVDLSGAITVNIPESTGRAGPGEWTGNLVVYDHGINRYGRWAGFGTASLTNQFIWPRSDFVPASGGCTVLLLYEKSDSTNRASVTWGVNIANGVSACHGAMPYSDGIVYFAFGGNTVNVTRLDVPSLTVTGPHVWVFTTGARGMECWQDGLLRGSNAANPSRTAAGINPFTLGSKTNQSASSDIAHYNVFAMWARQLTQDEILMVSADPYMLWESPSTPWYLSAVTGEGEAEAPSDDPYAGGLTIYKVTPERWG